MMKFENETGLVKFVCIFFEPGDGISNIAVYGKSRYSRILARPDDTSSSACLRAIPVCDNG